jgi:membrane protein insertase Oxa1/YidC/SpoIIIJ
MPVFISAFFSRCPCSSLHSFPDACVHLCILFQMPVFISVFVGMRKMANLPVPSMKEGGLSWFTDLTAVDPYYALPALTMLTFYLTIEVCSRVCMLQQ